LNVCAPPPKFLDVGDAGAPTGSIPKIRNKMSGPTQVLLKDNLSTETVEALQSYLRQFLNEKHSIERSDGRMLLHLHDADDVRMLRRHFPSLIASVHKAR
jgi:hypothetical protein